MRPRVGRFLLAFAIATLLFGRMVLAGPAQDGGGPSQSEPEATPRETRPAAGSLSLEDIASRIYRRLSEAQTARPSGEDVANVAPPSAVARTPVTTIPPQTPTTADRRVHLVWPGEPAEAPVRERVRVVLEWKPPATTPSIR